MSTAARSTHITSVNEYLALDAAAQDVRYEYLDGHVYALAGAAPEHNLIKDNIRAELHARLRERGCRSYTSDQRVRIQAARYVYPDVVVVCQEPEYTGERPPSLVNPEVLVEVTSAATARRDYEEKLDAYLQLDSLAEYWIVEPERPFIVQYVRRGKEWVVRPIRGLDAAVRSEHLDVKVAMTSIYALVDFPEEGAEKEA